MSKPSYVLRLTREGQSPTLFEFDKDLVTVGRETGDLPIGDPGASAKHAEIRFVDGVVQLRDVGSTNGIWLGTTKVDKEVMRVGTRFTIGGSSLELVEVKGIESAGSTMVMPAPGAGGNQPMTAPAAPPKTQAQPTSGPSPLQRWQRLPVATRKRIGIGAAALLLLVVVVMNLGGGAGGSTRKLTSTVEATVKAVWFRGPAGPEASGGTSPSTVRISPNKREGASVGLQQEFVGGAGNQWRTATWLAAFSASQLTGQNLTDYEFTVLTSGHIDGPSAGMLMTATMLALLRGVEPRADTTMTGTINPDGSAGPVGGIVQKMAGAAEDGIKRFGFPMGSRNHTDLRTQRTVDLFEAGKEFGLEVREIHDVFEAYEFLTGDRLARPAAVDDAEMELAAETAGRLRSKNEKWTARVKGLIAGIRNAARGLGPSGGKRIQVFAQRADDYFEAAQSFARSDFLTAAFDSFVQAAVYAGLTRDAARFLQALGRNDRDAMINQVNEVAAIKGQLSALLGETDLQARRQTGGGQINTLRAYQSAVAADSYSTLADNAYDAARRLLQLEQQGRASQQQIDALPELLFDAVRYYSIAGTMLDVAEDQKDFGSEQGQGAPIDLAVIGRSAAAYGSAAGAVLQYLESLTIDDAAKEAGIDKDTARNRLAANDDDYLLASRAVSIAEGIRGSSNENNILRLAAGSMAFLKGASLVNKYYSLGGQRAQSGELTLTNRKALSAQLDLGRQLAREAAAKCKQATGFIPVAARLAYQLGVARREGNDEDKLDALEAYWESAFWSELAASSPDRR